MPLLSACARRCTAPRIASGTGVPWGMIVLGGTHTRCPTKPGAPRLAGYEHLHVPHISYR
jgi:hypothetical protein